MDSDNNWMETVDGLGLLFYVPIQYGAHVYGTDTFAAIGANMVRLNLDTFVHGSSWMQCHQSYDRENLNV